MGVYYNIDPAAVIALLSKMPILKDPSFKVLEPCAGAGVLAKQYFLISKNPIDMIDIAPRQDNIIQQDYMKFNCYGKYDVIISTFPWGEDFSRLLNKALADVKEGGYVVSFQRVSSLTSKERYNSIYSRRRPEKILLFSRRLKCTKEDGKLIHSDKDFCWVIWHKVGGFYSLKTELEWVF